jgi:hypothetical protein
VKKVKLFLQFKHYIMKTFGEADVGLHTLLFFTTALDGYEWSASLFHLLYSQGIPIG